MLMKQQRTFQQQQKCLHVITCLLFSCLLLLIEWQAALATPILTKSITSTTITSSKTAARQGVGGVGGTGTRRLREHAKPSRENTRRGHVRGGGGGGANSSPCEHKSLGELIKTSPVILKALGAHIFNHDDDEDLRILHNSNDALLLKWQNEQNKVLTSLKRTEQLQQKFPYSTSFAAASSSSSQLSSSSPSLSLSAKKSAEKTRQLQNKQTLSSSRAESRQQQQTFSDAATNRAAMLASMNADAILITLTPETIYKGASLLKMTPNAAEHATSRTASSNGGGGSSSTSTNSIGNSNPNSDSGSGGSSGAGLNAGTINSSEASYLYEGQLNATVQPLSCFDDNLLKLLPSDLIIFGKLITIDEQQQQQRLHQTQQQQQTNDFLIDLNDYTSSSSASAQHRQQQPSTKDMLKISINGLHRWSSQFENYIWKHLGWDDWSDFTVCSVACGKGVQQRFRRCLLDNPMVNLNMNFKNDDEDDDDEEDDIDVDVDVDADVVVEMELEEDLVEDEGDDSSDSIMVDDVDDVDVDGGDENEQHKTIDGKHNVVQNFAASTTTAPTIAGDVNHLQNYTEKSNVLITSNMLHFVTTPLTKISIETTMKTEEEPEVMRIFEGHFNDTFPSTLEATARDTLTINNGKSFKEQLSSSAASALPLKDKVNGTKSKKTKLQQQQQQKQQQKRKTKHRKHKSAKFYSTMFCEGYNIEQRNCNSFECSDDINDLLKFYRKYPTTDETNTASTQTMMMDYSNTMAAAAASSVPTIAGTSSLSTTNSEIDGTAQNNENLNIFTTPINMGYVLNWHNILNFTIMLTLRVKNDSYTTATIFSIRNTTHNLYLESCKDGLRLYLERDKTTEMLPIKFNLYDYHWHQVAISIQNGDFISIHVDCSWTNSFVVSKRLFSLPLAADVEIGRGFNGELQQLLILPEHQERYQCSEKRTSINEVKRYIIDTFIDDYAN